MRAEVAEITAQDLGRRVPVPERDDEIGRLATTMNDMLDRLQHSAERERRFVADASHELQSPLAVEPGRPRGGAGAPGVDGVGGDRRGPWWPTTSG